MALKKVHDRAIIQTFVQNFAKGRVMDWSHTMAALIPGIEGVALRGLYAVTVPQTVSELHRRAGTGSRNGLRYALERLAAQGVVEALPAGNVTLYRLNTDHVAYPALDAALSMYDPYGLLRERIAAAVAAHFPIEEVDQLPTLAIYGSVARRDATTESDVDLVLVHPDGIRPDDPRVLGLIDALHRRVPAWSGNPAHIYQLSHSELRAAYRDGDPLTRSWEEEADTVSGPRLPGLMKQLAAA